MKEKDMDDLFRDNLKGMDGTPPDSQFDSNRAWDRIENRLDDRPKGGTGFRWWYAAAAILLIGMVSFFLLRNGNNVVEDHSPGMANETPDSIHATPENIPPVPHGMYSDNEENVVVPMDSDAVELNENAVAVNEQPQEQPKVQPKPKTIPQENVKPALADNQEAPSLKKEPLVKVKVILSEQKQTKDEILHAEWEKQNKLRIEVHDRMTDRIQTNFSDDFSNGFNGGSTFRKSLDLDRIRQEENKR